MAKLRIRAEKIECSNLGQGDLYSWKDEEFWNEYANGLQESSESSLYVCTGHETYAKDWMCYRITIFGPKAEPLRGSVRVSVIDPHVPPGVKDWKTDGR